MSGTFSPDTCPPIVYPVAAVAGSRYPNTRAVLDCIVSPEGTAVFQADGYRLLNRQR